MKSKIISIVFFSLAIGGLFCWWVTNLPTSDDWTTPQKIAMIFVVLSMSTSGIFILRAFVEWIMK